MVYAELLIALLLILVNGVLAMSEMAVVSARRTRLDFMASSGDRGARIALRLLDDPSRMLSTVQIGITLVGIVAGAFSGATLGDRLGDVLDRHVPPYGDALGVPIVVVLITYLSLVVGELVPKRIALGNPERIASLVAPPMDMLSRVAGPVVWLLKVSTDGLLRLLGLHRVQENVVTEEEVRSLIAEGTEAGVFVPEEREMIDGVLRLADRTVGVIMTPRIELVWLDLAEGVEGLLQALEEERRYSRLLVCEGTVDEPVGVVHVKDLAPHALRGREIDLREIMVQPLIVPEYVPVLRLVDQFRESGMHMAIIVDEFGTTLGIVTLTDVIESIAGELPETGEEGEARMVPRHDGSWLVDGAMPIDEFEHRTGLSGLQATGDFHTVAGFVLEQLGRIPQAGESFQHAGMLFEVVDMDGRRVDKLLVKPETAELDP